jgi:hypothetical protein
MSWSPLIWIGLAVVVIAVFYYRQKPEKPWAAESPAPSELPPLQLSGQPASRTPALPPPIDWATVESPAQSLTIAVPVDAEGREATEAQIRAVANLGIEVEGLTFRQANGILSARDYAQTLIARTKRIEPAVARILLICWLMEDPARADYVLEWSWRTKDQDSRRIPKDEFRETAERFLATIV